MSDEELKQAMAELQEVVRCRCDEAYRDRGLKDPHCECDSAEAVKIVADRIEELLAERKKDHANINLKADFIDKTINQLAEADAKLAQAVKLIDLAVELARWDRAPKLRDDMIDFTTEIKGEIP